MAELDDKTLKNLDQALQDMNSHLSDLDNWLKRLKKDSDATFDPKLIASWRDALNSIDFSNITKKQLKELQRQISKVEKSLSKATHDYLFGIKGNSNSNSYNASVSVAREYLELLKKINAQEVINKANSSPSKMTEKVVTKESLEAQKKVTDELKKQEAQHKKNNNEIKKQKGTVESLIPSLKRLASAFGVAFSVRGLAQFGKKLIETRGEFEMQFVAMKQIIGDVDAATKIWNQTMQQALQSPFKAMQLVTYTKQLAAYRIETEKLFDTTKRLADISAGLGVDMGRLILAYGQVKSATFLRASEVRQFTEAGVNIAGGLAKYFTELEGRAVGTAEVMERITKRMVLFSDVEAVFKRMTDEGGEFFNMQEVQADTVKGQIMKLHDAYDQMLNTIGQANQGTIRDLVDALNNLVRHWRDIASFIMKNVNAMIILVPLIATFRKGAKLAAGETFTWSRAMKQLELDLAFAGSGMKKFSLSTALGTSAVYLFKGAVEVAKTALKTFVPLLAIEGILWLVTKLQSANRELENMKKELSDLASESTTRMNEEIRGYELLIEKLKQTTEGTMARKEVIDEISQKYGKYLDFIVTEKTTIEELAGAYDNVVSSIRNYTAEKIREEQQQRLEKGMYDEHQNLVNILAGRTLTEKGRTSKLSKEQAKQIVKLIESELEKNPQIGTLEIYKVIRDYLGKNISSEEGMTREFQKFINKYTKLKTELQDIRDDIESNTPVFATEQDYKDYKKNVEAAEQAIKKQKESSEEQINYLKEATRESDEQWIIDDRIAELRLANEEKILEIRKQYGLLTEDQYKQELARLHGTVDEYESDYNTRLENSLIKKYGIFWENNKEARDMYNYVVSTEQALQQGTTQRNKQLIDTYKGLKDSLEQYKKALEAALTSGAGQAAIAAIQANIDTTILHMTAIEDYAAILRGLDLSDKKKTPRGSKENASKLISLIKEMRSEYDKLSKSAYGYAKSEEKVREAYKDSVKEILGKAGITDYDFTTNEGMIKALERVKSYATKLGKDAAAEVQKYIDQLETEIEINAQVKIKEDFGRQIEKMFSDYELSLNFESMGIPEDLAKDLFGIDTSSLDEISSYLQRFATEHAEDWNEDINKIYADALKKISDKEQEQYKKDVSDLFKRVKSSAAEMRVVIEQACEDINFAQNLFDPNYVDQATKDIKAKIQQNLEEINRLTPSEGKAEGVVAQQIARLEDENKILENRVMRLTQMYGNISAEQYTDLVRSTIEWENERTQKISMEQLKKMPEYLEAMGRTAGWSNVKLREMLDYLKNLISVSGSDMSLEDYKTVVNQIDKIQEQIKSNDYPFGREGFAKVAQMLEEQTEADEQMKQLEEERNKLQEESKRLNEELVGLQERLNALKAENHEENKDEIREVEDQIEENLRNQNQNANQQRKVAAGIQTITKGNMQTMVIIDAIIHAVNDAVQDLYKSLEKIEVVLQDYSIDTEHGSWAKWAKGMETFAKASQDATNGWEAYKKGDIAGIVLEVVNGIVDIWHGINEIVNQKQVDTIYFNEEKIEDLKRAYERLDKQISKTWDTVSYMQNYTEMADNLYEQIEALNQQLAAEEAKKNTDKEAVKEYQDKIQDAEDELENLKQKQIEVFGGIGEEGYRDAAQGFVDAWKSAFLETGDGLQGLQDHFDEFLNEWFVKQATMRVAGKMLEPLFRDIDNAVEKYGDGGTSVMMSELAKVRERFGIIAPELSDALEELTSLWGLGGEGSLSGLAAGIQGMTEEQANILEAYWNSVRGYTANIDMNVSRIAQILGAGGDNSNPMLAQMTLVAQNTNNINTLLQSVTKSGHSQGGYGIKVFAN